MRIRMFKENDSIRIADIYKKAFAGAPWCESLSNEIVLQRWDGYRSRNGFTCFVVEISDIIVGATWFDVPIIDELIKERGEALGEFIRSKSNASECVWIRDTIVDPSFQGRGIATQIKIEALRKIKEKFPNWIILTRMRKDNFGIIKINERLGFRRTGIQIPSSQKKGIFHEYWSLSASMIKG